MIFDPIPLPNKSINTGLSTFSAFANVGQAFTLSENSTQGIIDDFLQLVKKHGDAI